VKSLLNIEEFFRNIFRDFRVNPSGKLWGNIKSSINKEEYINIDDEHIDDLGSFFENSEVTPSDKVWNRISSEMKSKKYTQINLNELDEAGHLFHGFKVQPSPGVWANISKDLAKSPLQQFLQNTWNHVLLNKVASMLLILGTSFVFGVQISEKQETASPSLPAISIPADTDAMYEDQKVQASNKLRTSERAPVENTLNADMNQKSLPENRDIAEYTSPGKTEKPIPAENLNRKAEITPVVEKEKKNEIPALKSKVPVFEEGSKRLLLLQPHNFTKDMSKANMTPYRDIDPDKFYKKWKKTFNSSSLKYFVELNYLHRYAYTDMIKGKNSFNYPMQNYDENESLVSPEYNMGLAFGYMRNAWVFESGLLFESVNTATDHSFKWSLIDSIINTEKVQVFNIYDGTWKTEYRVTDTVYFMGQEEVFLSSSKCSYQVLSVPLLIGYRFQNYRSSFVLKSGPVFGFVMNKNRTLLDPHTEPEMAFEYPEISDFHLSLAFNLEYNYGISNHLYIKIAPELRFPLNAFYRNYPLNKRVYSYGLRLGLKYCF
jgi:hypothetical protein